MTELETLAAILRTLVLMQIMQMISSVLLASLLGYFVVRGRV